MLNLGMICAAITYECPHTSDHLVLTVCFLNSQKEDPSLVDTRGGGVSSVYIDSILNIHNGHQHMHTHCLPVSHTSTSSLSLTPLLTHLLTHAP